MSCCLLFSAFSGTHTHSQTQVRLCVHVFMQKNHCVLACGNKDVDEDIIDCLLSPIPPTYCSSSSWTADILFYSDKGGSSLSKFLYFWNTWSLTSDRLYLWVCRLKWQLLIKLTLSPWVGWKCFSRRLYNVSNWLILKQEPCKPSNMFIWAAKRLRLLCTSFSL